MPQIGTKEKKGKKGKALDIKATPIEEDELYEDFGEETEEENGDDNDYDDDEEGEKLSTSPSTSVANSSNPSIIPPISTNVSPNPPVSKPIPITKEAIDLEKRNRKAAAMEAKRTLPKPPCKIGSGVLTWEQMQEWFGLLTSDMWSHLLIYTYRTKPFIIRQLSDETNKNYIDCISEPFDMDYILNVHGGGDYRFDVTDNDIQKRLFQSKLSIPITMAMPKLDYRELDLNAKENRAYIQKLQAEGILDERGKVKMGGGNNQGSGSTGSTDAVALTKEILSFVGNLTKQQQQEIAKKVAPDDGIGKGISDILLERMRQDDPNKQVATMATLLTTLKDMFGGGMGKQQDSISTMDIIKIIQDSNNKQMEMMKLMMEMNKGDGGKGGDDFDRIEKLLTITEMLKGGGGKRSGWEIAADVAKEVMNPLLSVIGNAMALKANSAINSSPISGVQQAIPSPIQSPTQTQPITGSFNDIQSQQAKVVQMPMKNEQQSPGQSPIQQDPNIEPNFVQALQAQGGFIISAIHSGKAGYEFAEDLINFLPNGLAVHAQISSIGKDRILYTMKAVPEFWGQVSMFGEEKIAGWVEEFIEYEKYLGEGEEIEDNSEPEIDSTPNPPNLPTTKGKGKKGA